MRAEGAQPGVCNNLEGSGGEGSGARGHVCACGRCMSLYGRSLQNIVKQLSQLKIKTKVVYEYNRYTTNL